VRKAAFPINESAQDDEKRGSVDARVLASTLASVGALTRRGGGDGGSGGDDRRRWRRRRRVVMRMDDGGRKAKSKAQTRTKYGRSSERRLRHSRLANRHTDKHTERWREIGSRFLADAF